ncbi:MAG: type II toxin-antitoxin system PemK/MazF family toxin [Ruminococcaceae bacterium]|nr:type II toxin-antitoxin system PemK/MazF family toxin [Oscillospiraceae bacterium]
MLILMTETTTYIRKGDIFYVELGKERNGSVQNGGATGVRPCVVMANKVACNVSPVLLVVPITSSFGKQHKSMPTHLELGNILPKKSVALFEQVLTVNRYQLRDKIAKLSDDLLEEANQKIMISFGLIPQYA